MTRESLHEKILKEEQDILEQEKVLAAIKQTLTEYGTTPQGAAVFDTEMRELNQRKRALALWIEADTLYVKPSEKKAPSAFE